MYTPSSLYGFIQITIFFNLPLVLRSSEHYRPNERSFTFCTEDSLSRTSVTEFVFQPRKSLCWESFTRLLGGSSLRALQPPIIAVQETSGHTCSAAQLRTRWWKDNVVFRLFFVLLNCVLFLALIHTWISILLCWYCFSHPENWRQNKCRHVACLTTIRLIFFQCQTFMKIVNVNHLALKKGRVIMWDDVFSEQSNIVYRHFFMLCGLLVFVFCCFFLLLCLMLAITFLLSYSCELAHELSTCVYVHHCAWLALLERVFNTLKTICHTARPHISSFFIAGVYERAKTRRYVNATGGVSAITVTVVITKGQQRSVAANRHPLFYMFVPSILAPVQKTSVYCMYSDKDTSMHTSVGSRIFQGP